MKDALKGRHCENCDAFHQPDPKQSGMCIRNPPVPMVVGIKSASSVLDPKAQQKVAPMIEPYYPPVSPKHGCRDGWRFAGRPGEEADGKPKGEDYSG